MNIVQHNIPIRDVVDGFSDNDEEGVFGYGGKLNIRPKYQREFIYTGKQLHDVIRTIRKGFPLNVMYWVENNDGTYEMLDGQQRTLSIAKYFDGQFSVDFQYFHNLTEDEQKQFLDYELLIYFCSGTDREKLDWFQIINIAGEKLTPQELRNAIYSGSWVTDAKRYFSKTQGPAHQIASDYVSGRANRQEYLEKAIKWISNAGSDTDTIANYMSEHQHKPNANELWMYFRRVIDWVQLTFPEYHREMKKVEWGPLYNEFHTITYDTQDLSRRVDALMLDEDVENKAGIFPYLLNGKEKHLSIRAFSEAQKRSAYSKQKGICAVCNEHFDIAQMEADHITPWVEGGKTVQENCQVLCVECNRRKGHR